MIELISSLEFSFEEIIGIMKMIGNRKRLKILIILLSGEHSFDSLKKSTGVKKTALANHLTRLIEEKLIEKPDHGKYRITQDGERFIRAIEIAFEHSDIFQSKRMDDLQKGQFSQSFVKSFFKRS